MDPNATINLKYYGFGGWLTLVIVGLCFTPITIGVYLVNDVIPTFKSWSLYTSPESELYHPLFGLLFIFGALMGIVFLVASLILLFLLFTKHPSFPKWMIVYLISHTAYIILDALVTYNIINSVVAFQSVATELEKEIDFTVTRAIISSAIWIPYLKKSKRVKATFRPRIENPVEGI